MRHSLRKQCFRGTKNYSGFAHPPWKKPDGKGLCLDIAFPMPMKSMPTMPIRSIFTTPFLFRFQFMITAIKTIPHDGVVDRWQAKWPGVFYPEENKCHDVESLRVMPEYARGPHSEIAISTLRTICHEPRLPKVSTATGCTVRGISSEGSGTIAGR